MVLLIQVPLKQKERSGESVTPSIACSASSRMLKSGSAEASRTR